jgi:hypothetical protein
MGAAHPESAAVDEIATGESIATTGDDGAESRNAHGTVRIVHPGRTPEAILQQVDTELKGLDEVTRLGSLDEVHGHAFAVRDLVRALPAVSGTLSTADRSALQQHIARVDKEAAALDRAGDDADLTLTTTHNTALKAAVNEIRSLYYK